jgi:hypothetical protein
VICRLPGSLAANRSLMGVRHQTSHSQFDLLQVNGSVAQIG